MNTFRFLSIIACLFFLQNGNAQTNSLTQPEQAEQLLNLKNSVNNSFSIYPNYSVWIFESENKDEAENVYNNFLDTHRDIEITIIRSSTKYKVFVGNFRNKIEAFELHKKLKKDFPKNYMVRLKQ